MEKYRFKVDFRTVYLNVTNANYPYCYIPAEVRRRGRKIDYMTLEDLLTKFEEYLSILQGKKLTLQEDAGDSGLV